MCILFSFIKWFYKFGTFFLIAKGHSIKVRLGTERKSDIYWWGGQSNSCCRCFMSFSWRELSHSLWCLDRDWQPHFRATPFRMLPKYLAYALSGFSAGPVTRNGFFGYKVWKVSFKTTFYPRALAWASYYIQISTVCINSLLI